MGTAGAEVLRRLLASLALAAPLALAACGGDSFSPEAAVAEAATKTRAESARLTYTALVEGGAATSVTIEAEGAFSPEGGRMTMDLSGVPGGAGRGNGKIEVVFADTVVYMRFPGRLAADLPAGKRWVSLDFQELGNRAGFDVLQFQQFSQSDPTQTLEFLRGATDDFERVGEEDVRGTPTTHYRGTVDLREVADQASEEASASYRRVIELAGTAEVPFQAWLDEQGRARRIAYDMPLPAQGGGGKMTVTMEFFDFGAEVSVEPPPANEVVDLATLLGRS